MQRGGRVGSGDLLSSRVLLLAFGFCQVFCRSRIVGFVLGRRVADLSFFLCLMSDR